MTKNFTTEDSDMPIYTLTDICSTPSSEHGYNENYGLLGSNKATEEKIKLFPRHDACKKVCDSIQNYIKKEYDVTVEVMGMDVSKIQSEVYGNSQILLFLHIILMD